MSWLKSIFGVNDKEVEAIKEDTNEEVSGLNFKTALEAHIKWKIRLQGVIDGTSTEVLDPRIVSVDNQCALGQWIYGTGSHDFGDNPEFKALITSHTHFHKCAGHTLALALEGKTAEAQSQIDGGDYAKASLGVSRQLMRLWRSIGI